MRYTLLGNSGLRVSEVALGTMTCGTDWGWGASKGESAKQFELFAEAGGTLIDTANKYTDGSAESILGDLLAGSGDQQGAIEAWKRIEQQNPEYLALVAQRLLESHRALGRTGEGLTLLRGYLSSFPSLDLLDVAFQSTLDAEGADAAYKLVKDELKRSQTLLGLDKLLEAQLMAAPAERRNDLELVKGLVGQHIKRLGMYRCEQCGFRAKQYYWRCPGCGKWETYSPRRTETPDGYA